MPIKVLQSDSSFKAEKNELGPVALAISGIGNVSFSEYRQNLEFCI